MANLFSPAWDNPTSLERAELVFQNRNKEYGAYEIRRSYEKTAAKALIISIIAFSILVSIPVLVKLLGKGEKIDTSRPVEVNVELMEPPPLDKNEPPPPPPPPPPPTIETVKFTPPKVVDEEIIDEPPPPPQEKLSETNVGVVTQEGDEGAVELPPEPVVEDPGDNQIYTFVQEFPTFPGGEGAMAAYLRKHINYPPIARENNIQGKVFINFVVDKEGNIKDVKVLRGIGYGCDEEAVRVVKQMPPWKPGKQNGRSVPVSLNVPINFTLK
jgi:periplasmic protein TonB